MGRGSRSSASSDILYGDQRRRRPGAKKAPETLVSDPTLDPVTAKLQAEVEMSRQAIMELVRQEPASWWEAHRLKDKARTTQSSGAVNIAFRRLLESGELQAGARDKVCYGKVPPRR